MNILQQQASLGLAVGLEFIEKEGLINRNNLVFNCRNFGTETTTVTIISTKKKKGSLALQPQSQSFIL
jgi:hypothetical protein